MRKNYFTDFSFLLNTTREKKTNLTNKIDFKKNYSLFVLFLTLFTLFPSSNYGQSNNCGNATNAANVLTPGATCVTTAYSIGKSMDNEAATPAICTGTCYRDGWMSFTTNATTTTVSIVGTSNRTMGLAIYTGACGSLTQVACVNPGTSGATLNATVSPSTTYRLRIMRTNNDDADAMTGNICVIATQPCATPSQATLYTAGANTSTTIPATFTGSADGYLIIQSTSATPPTHPVNGTLYNAASINAPTNALGTGYTFVENSTDTSFSGTGLTGNTKYYYYIYAYNNISCTGGPAYATGVLTSSGITCPAVPTSVTTSAVANNSFTLNWVAPAGGSASAVTYTVEVSTNNIFTAQITGSPFSAIAATTLNVTGLAVGTTYYYHVRANNGCSSAYTTTASVTTTAPGLTNNDPCGAIALTVNTSCTYVAGTNVGATASSGVPAPGCASYTDDDVWYKAIVPANGILNIDTQAGTITDSGMALYSGAVCGTLSLIECDDDDSLNGLMSFVTLSGRTPGETIYIRVWEYGGDVNGTFSICASSPAPVLCANNPSNIIVTPTSQTTATVTWNPATPIAPTDGYQYYYSTSSTAPGATPTPLVNVPTGTTANLTGLLSGSTYYIWIRSNCNVTLGQGVWIGSIIFIMPNCSLGNHNGTTTLGCPEVISGGLNLNGVNPPAVACSAASTCVDLEAKYLNIGDTTNYTVAKIPGAFSPPYQFGCLQNPVSVNIDDRWSPVVTFPFEFCFFGISYQQCLISSNGAISFDLAGNGLPAGFSEFAFAANLPSPTLFKNSIFGVYHDIDPSKGGEVGWELITLNTGCRAIVASWKDIPMFSDNTKKYTGMMVFYENTNVIEVYIKEKNIVATWNDGNAIVGIQNYDGTKAVVAPGRNGLDTNWPITDEAWRFTPSGPSITSIKWHEGAGTAGPVIGTNDLITVCPTATTVYTAEVTYSLCSGDDITEVDQTTVTIDGSKVWNGSVSNAWSTANNWTPPGVPTAADCVIIPDVVTPNSDPVISGAGYNGLGLNLTVQPAGSLTVATPNSNITITDKVTVNTNGIFTLNNAAGLIQTNNVINTGNITMQRTAYVDKYDYVFWSSPVTPFNSTAISPTTSNTIRKWVPTIPANLYGFGNWTSGVGLMQPGLGYAERNLNGAALNAPVNFTANFTGVPNNGNIDIAIARGSYTGGTYSSGVPGTALVTDKDDNWNLIGNPYPSAISADAFIGANTTNLAGYIQIWRHGILPSTLNADPYYSAYLYNYDLDDYLTYNLSGPSDPVGFNGFIGAGQGFIVEMKHTSPTNSSFAHFTNAMRKTGLGVPYANDQFYKTANTEPTQKGRIWLDIVSPTTSKTALVAYVDGATNEKDQLYDAPVDLKSAFSIYTLTGTDYERLMIQGRSLPFDQEDQVPVAIKIAQNGNYSIAIHSTDGFFDDASQNIFIEDKLLNVTHDLRSAPYSFTSNTGEYLDRFVLRYTQTALGNEDFDYANEVKVFANNYINVNSTSQSIKEVAVYDVLGKTLTEMKKVGKNEVVLTNLKPTTNVIIVKVTLDNNKVVIKKVIY